MILVDLTFLNVLRKATRVLLVRGIYWWDIANNLLEAKRNVLATLFEPRNMSTRIWILLGKQ